MNSEGQSGTPPDPIEQAIFNAARDLTQAETRTAFLDRACGSDSSLRLRIEALLAADARAVQFFSEDPLGWEPKRGAVIPAPSAAPGVTPEQPVGTRIGRYKLLEKIGEGGMGVVYMAEQEEPVRRRVALKIIKLGMDTRQVVARFEAERQALALMDHPNIARVLDGGATDSPGSAGILPASSVSFTTDRPAGADAGAPRQVHGQEPGGSASAKSPIASGLPYFVMELVQGVPITEFCDKNRLSVEQRIKLFIPVCQAIQSAHQKGIIHRDLKPSNVLVTLHDSAPVPKVIDFGVAKATNQKLTEKTLFTNFATMIGTPAYMSPEQAELSGLDIDTRSDIYSLGVLLYELLTGTTPFPEKRLRSVAYAEMQRIVLEEEPEKPSTRLKKTLAAVATMPFNSKSEIRNPKSEIEQDLDWIVMKCLEKDRNRRYETASGLVSDIQRHLNNEPVVACPPSNLYRFQKLVRRNKLAFIAGGSVVAALVIGFAIALRQSIEKGRAYKRAVAAELEQSRLRRKAQTEAAKSTQVAHFFEEMLAGVGPEIAKGRDATLLKEVLDNTAQRLGAELSDQPDIEAYLWERIANVYQALGDYPAADSMHRRVLTLQRQVHPDGHRDVAEALNNLAMITLNRGRLSEAESLMREALAMGKHFPGPYPTDPAAWLNNLATILRHEARFAEAEATYREALAENKRVLGREHREIAAALNNLAIALAEQKKLEESEALLRESIAMSNKLFGNDNPLTAQSLTTLTSVLTDAGKLEEAETIGREAVAMQDKMLGRDHPNVALALNNLAIVLVSKGELSEAESLHREVVAIHRNKLGGQHPMLGHSLHELGWVLSKRGNLPEAETMLREALAIAGKFPTNAHVNAAEVLSTLNKVLAAEGKPSFTAPNPEQAARPDGK